MPGLHQVKVASFRMFTVGFRLPARKRKGNLVSASAESKASGQCVDARLGPRIQRRRSRWVPCVDFEFKGALRVHFKNGESNGIENGK